MGAWEGVCVLAGGLAETTQMASASTGALGNRSRKENAPKALAISCGDVLTS